MDQDQLDSIAGQLDDMDAQLAPPPEVIVGLLRSEDPKERAAGLIALYPESTTVVVTNRKGRAMIHSTNSPPMELMGCLVWGAVQLGEILGMELKWTQATPDQDKLVVAADGSIPGGFRG